ncbi:MAG TPA: polysaccharide pyruvyl transferase family protein [Candidatus Avipropionibacterium avicola]|uniref:Polysaccharide pyruvyl transferase family protein n=1 Tax=Candidatus Avipropionibacterium avicola TaxID=2840701 RepID=A0A9D1H0T6_9ACTN|nr:polysaccharide pyruvyl transferase family protein [Candidatus Avipropionibacterium avicola]
MTHIGVVAGWQADNIGDVAHIPGTLVALQRRHPDARLSLLVHNINERELRMLARYFPDVTLVTDRLEADAPVTPELERFLSDVDVLVHGSGPALVAGEVLQEWSRRTQQPYGVFAITVDPIRPYEGTLDHLVPMIHAIDGDLLTELEREVFSGASFLHTRESLSRDFLQGQDIGPVRPRFGPDATVLCDFYDDADGRSVIEEYDLVDGEFLCAVPRLRFTPYHTIRGYAPGPEDHRKMAYNAGHVQDDFEVLRAGITAWVRRTGHRALIVPEMSYAVATAQQHLAGTFPEDVADKILVLPRFWELQEAAAVYRHSAGVLSMECHSPLLAVAEAVPTVYLRQPTDTIKGHMYRDLGLDSHLVEVDHDDAVAQVEQVVTTILDDTDAARDRMQAAKDLAAPLLASMADDVVASITTPTTGR